MLSIYDLYDISKILFSIVSLFSRTQENRMFLLEKCFCNDDDDMQTMLRLAHLHDFLNINKVGSI